MKLMSAIFLLVFSLYSSIAYSNSYNVENTYKNCKVWQNSNFDKTKLNASERIAVIKCLTQIKTYLDIGRQNCVYFKSVYKDLVNEDKLVKDKLKILALLTSNKIETTVMQGVISFIKFAENNPNKFNEELQHVRVQWLNKQFYCNIEKPNP